MAPPLTRTEQGWELQFATNHLGHFALTTGLHRALAAAGDARVVTVSSVGHLHGEVDFDDVNFEYRAYDPWLAYSQSKTANVLFAVEAADRWLADGITVNALNPGRIRTNLMRFVGDDASGQRTGRVRADQHDGALEERSKQGAATSVLLAASPLLDGVSGRYFEDCNEAEPAQPGVRRGVADHAVDPVSAARLWQISIELLSGQYRVRRRPATGCLTRRAVRSGAISARDFLWQSARRARTELVQCQWPLGAAGLCARLGHRRDRLDRGQHRAARRSAAICNVGFASLQWTVTAYTLTLASFILLGGSLGDRLGRRRVFIIGIVWFAITSLLCALAPTAGLLIGARALQGIGGALMTPASLAILQASFTDTDRTRAIGAWSGLSGTTSAIAPFLGGWLIQAGSWRAVFLINPPLCALVIVLALRHMPETRDPAATGRLDVTGSVLGVLGLGGLTAGIIAAADHGFALGRRCYCRWLVGVLAPGRFSAGRTVRTEPDDAADVVLLAAVQRHEPGHVPALRGQQRLVAVAGGAAGDGGPVQPARSRHARCCRSPSSCWRWPPGSAPWRSGSGHDCP